MFLDGQLFDIATVIRSAGESCVDLGVLLGEGFGRCIKVDSLLDCCHGQDSVEVGWSGGNILSISTCQVCYILTIRDHDFCE